MQPRRAFRALMSPRALVPLAFLAFAPLPPLVASEEEDAKELANAKEQKKPQRSEEGPALQDGHGKASHSDAASGRDPGPEEGHGDTHDVASEDGNGPVKLKPAKDNHAENEHAAESGTRDAHAAKAKSIAHRKESKAIWEDGLVWFGVVFLTLLVALFIFI